MGEQVSLSSSPAQGPLAFHPNVTLLNPPRPALLLFTLEIRIHSLTFCLRVSPGMNRFLLEVSESQFRLAAPHHLRSTNLSESGPAMGESGFSLSGGAFRLFMGIYFIRKSLRI